MTVGIYTRYAHCDESYFALRLASFLQENGADFSVYSAGPMTRLGVGFDRFVQDKTNIRFTDWVTNKSVVVWTHVPASEQLMWARKRGVRTIIVPLWQELRPPFRRAIRQADTVIATSKEARELFRDVYKFKNVLLIPFDTGLPITKKKRKVDPRRVRLFLPWFDRNARCTQSSFLLQLERILCLMPQTYLTVSISSSKFAPAIGKFFKRLNNVTGGRVTTIRGSSLRERPRLFAQADLTIFPAECDNYGITGLTSLNLGTPVVSFAVPPQNDFIYTDINGVLVKTELDYDENGVPHANPDYLLFFEVVQALIAETELIDKLNNKVGHNLQSRRRSFDLGWNLFFK